MILNFLIIFLFLFEYIKSGVLEDCEIGNYCSSGACSIYGNCRFEKFIRMNENSTNSICMCNRGYSSYDIDELNLNERSIYCCYKKKSQFTAFLLEICLGFGMGHFYIGDIKYGLIKFFLELFFCFMFCCLIYRACIHEHEVVINLNNFTTKDEYKLNENIDNEEIKELNDNIENDKISDNSSKNDEEEDSRYNEILTKDLIKCPLYKFFIYLCLIILVIIYLFDGIFFGIGFYKDKNGEKLEQWF